MTAHRHLEPNTRNAHEVEKGIQSSRDALFRLVIALIGSANTPLGISVSFRFLGRVLAITANVAAVQLVQACPAFGIQFTVNFSQPAFSVRIENVCLDLEVWNDA